MKNTVRLICIMLLMTALTFTASAERQCSLFVELSEGGAAVYRAADSAAAFAESGIPRDGERALGFLAEHGEPLSGERTEKGVMFSGLPGGVYLVAPADGAVFLPFFTELPLMQDGLPEYDVSAVPKTEQDHRETTPAQNPPAQEDRHDSLPRTGQLWVPIPLLAAGGLMLIFLSLVLRKHG